MFISIYWLLTCKQIECAVKDILSQYFHGHTLQPCGQCPRRPDSRKPRSTLSLDGKSGSKGAGAKGPKTFLEMLFTK